MQNEKLEKMEHDKYVAEKKLTAAKHRERQLQSEIQRLTRSERTHRFCTRAGMLETFLREPTLLTDEDVMEMLTFLFHGEAAQKKLDMLIEGNMGTGTINLKFIVPVPHLSVAEEKQKANIARKNAKDEVAKVNRKAKEKMMAAKNQIRFWKAIAVGTFIAGLLIGFQL